MHAFLERLIDVQYLRHSRDQSVAQFRFVDRLPERITAFSHLRPALETSIRAALVSAADDTRLSRRLLNALYDSLGFYRFTESPDDRYFRVARDRERRGEISGRWLSLVHPPEALIPFDVLNRAGAAWAHPCRPSTGSTRSIPELVAEAATRTRVCWELWERAAHAPDPRHIRELQDAIGVENLNDGITGDPPCRRETCEPFPLIELYASIKRAVEA